MTTVDPPARPGAYSGQTQGHYELKFMVTPDARAIKAFDTALVVYCTDFSGTQPIVKHVAIPKFAIGADGRFAKTYRATVDDIDLTVKVSGNLDKGVLRNGRIKYFAVGTGPVSGIECLTDGAQPMTARRR